MGETLLTVILTVIASSAFWAGAGAVFQRLRFDGIAVGTVPVAAGALGVYIDALRGFSIHLKVVNVTSHALAVERASVTVKLKPKSRVIPLVQASGECSVSNLPGGPYDFDRLSYGLSPVVITANGGEGYVHVEAGSLSYRRKVALLPVWKRIGRLDMSHEPTLLDKQGHAVYHGYFEFPDAVLHLQVNGKIRKLPVQVLAGEGAA